MPTEGYVLHCYGDNAYARHAVASVSTLRRYDTTRPVALYCPPKHQSYLADAGVDALFERIEPLPEAHRSIVGFKHHIDRFMPYDRCLFVDTDMVWCRHPNPLWQQLKAFPFTATGRMRADFFFGGPKGLGVLLEVLLNRRDRTLQEFGLSYLPRVQAGMLYAQDRAVTETFCTTAQHFLAQEDATHFRSRLNEGRSEESCEWSMAMAMSELDLHVFSWMQGHNTPQLDFIDGLTTYDPDFEHVVCDYYTFPFVHDLRGIPNAFIRDLLIALLTRLPGMGDRMRITPFVLHFGWLHEKEPFHTFAERAWKRLSRTSKPSLFSSDGAPSHLSEAPPE
jgi:hypothetical protein